MKKYLQAVAAILFCEAVGIAGSIFTAPAIPSWYAGLVKPLFSPPNWLFAPVWTTLYAMMGLSVHLMLGAKADRKKTRSALYIFLIQLLLNFMWSLIFFGFRSPGLALAEIIILWLAILVTVRRFYAISRIASFLLVPYLLWVSFAAFLNAAIFLLNLNNGY